MNGPETKSMCSSILVHLTVQVDLISTHGVAVKCMVQTN